ncbi:MAG: hypothetical protein II007_00830 [Gammaproteobacteria bacterium]|nr:hypothetical protein [Gammaproteobacteria bacterium]
MLYDSDPTRPEQDELPSAGAGTQLWQQPAFEILLLVALLFGAIASLHCHSLLPLALSLLLMLVASRQRRSRHISTTRLWPSRTIPPRRCVPAASHQRPLSMAQPPTTPGKPSRRP